MTWVRDPGWASFDHLHIPLFIFPDAHQMQGFPKPQEHKSNNRLLFCLNVISNDFVRFLDVRLSEPLYPPPLIQSLIKAMMNLLIICIVFFWSSGWRLIQYWWPCRTRRPETGRWPAGGPGVTQGYAVDKEWWSLGFWNRKSWRPQTTEKQFPVGFQSQFDSNW